MRVLVVEDFEPMARGIVTGLRREGMAVDAVHDGVEALSQLASVRYDVVVLDRDLPGVHGDEICSRLAAARSPTRILMLTAAGRLTDRVEGLNLGADDYLANHQERHPGPAGGSRPPRHPPHQHARPHPGHRRPAASREPDRQPRRQRDQAQRPRRPGRHQHRPDQRRRHYHGRQQRYPHPPARDRRPLPAIPATRPSAGRPRRRPRTRPRHRPRHRRRPQRRPHRAPPPPRRPRHSGDLPATASEDRPLTSVCAVRGPVASGTVAGGGRGRVSVPNIVRGGFRPSLGNYSPRE
jgi:CheY-like chemotaxis protein